jgi:hypothetical protein
LRDVALSRLNNAELIDEFGILPSKTPAAERLGVFAPDIFAVLAAQDQS